MPGSKATKKSSKKKTTKFLTKKSTKSSTRKGPPQSSVFFEVGTKKRGNDGRIWKIVSYNGIKRWIAPK
jgi:hypothetical protein